MDLTNAFCVVGAMNSRRLALHALLFSCQAQRFATFVRASLAGTAFCDISVRCRDSIVIAFKTCFW